MIPPLQACHRILWGNVELDGKIIPVVKRSYPYDKTPCITIDDSGGSAFIERHIMEVPKKITPNHPQYDVEHPFKKIPQQIIREEFETTLNINIWCDTEDEREKLNQKVLLLFHQAQSDHYKFCNNYQDGQCSYLGTGCYGEHFDKAMDKRGVKHQCTNPKVHGYKNIFTTYNLIRANFYIDQPFSLDDFTKDNVLLRSVLKLHSGYFVDHIIGGYEIKEINLDNRLL